MIVARAPAKLNLTLEVLGKRPDGYHEILSLMHSIDLSDRLTFEMHDRIALSCNDPRLCADDNLVIRAARLLNQHGGGGRGARMTLDKRIPSGSGLGGGSSDAAAALAALNELWALGLSTRQLVRIGAELGSDVPFFQYGGCAVAEGRGEKVTPLTAALDFRPLLLFPPVPELPAKTAALYASLRPQDFTSGQYLRAAVRNVQEHGTLPEDGLHNVFEEAARQAFSGMSEFWTIAEQAAGQRFHLSGSGPTLFAWCSGEEQAAQVTARLREHGLDPWPARTLCPPRRA